METIAIASFLSRTEKQPYVRIAIRKVDTLKILLMVLWALSVPLNDIGKMLGGWNGQLAKQNSPTP
jgi:hypothetical protein